MQFQTDRREVWKHFVFDGLQEKLEHMREASFSIYAMSSIQAQCLNNCDITRVGRGLGRQSQDSVSQLTWMKQEAVVG